MAAYDAVVLAGGGAARLGGVDKPALVVGGRTMLERVVAACAGAGRTVVVGPARELGGVLRAREDPPGGGPVAALAAGLGRVTAERVLLLAADLPFLDRGTLERLLAALDDPEPEAALLVDAGGQEQPLTAAYRTAALRAALAELGDPAGQSLRRLLAPLRTVRVADRGGAAFDCDTWQELALARERAAARPGVAAGEQSES
ncbi:NTP transferase domain-containing protein [Kitasatospora sp. NPDC094015]|uniref:molybdenum cofactor guanylyltransferase n=1 Tax=Kitasatospora sp. NPDC094015 TaxID=3155205 RepID=UPI00332BF807